MGRAGLIGKVQINSTMSESDVRKLICAVFAKSMGLTEEHFQNGQYFPFSYLQKAGSGSEVSVCCLLPHTLNGMENKYLR